MATHISISRVKFQLFDSFLGKILQPAILTHSASEVARSIAFDLKKILPSSEFQNSSWKLRYEGSNFCTFFAVEQLEFFFKCI